MEEPSLFLLELGEVLLLLLIRAELEPSLCSVEFHHAHPASLQPPPRGWNSWTALKSHEQEPPAPPLPVEILLAFGLSSDPESPCIALRGVGEAPTLC